MDNNGLSYIDDIVNMIDGMCENGHGHINVSYDGSTMGKSVDTLGCTDCAKGDLACAQPTLTGGIQDNFADNNN